MSLIERLEAAECGSRELDAEVAVVTCWPALGRIKHWVHDERMEVRESGNIGFKDLPDNPAEWSSPEVTTSLDAALALAERVLPGHAMNVCKDQGPHDGPEFRWSSVIARHSLEGPVGRPGWWFGVSDTPALALCIAILKAKETK